MWLHAIADLLMLGGCDALAEKRVWYTCCMQLWCAQASLKLLWFHLSATTKRKWLRGHDLKSLFQLDEGRSMSMLLLLLSYLMATPSPKDNLYS